MARGRVVMSPILTKAQAVAKRGFPIKRGIACLVGHAEGKRCSIEFVSTGRECRLKFGLGHSIFDMSGKFGIDSSRGNWKAGMWRIFE